MDCPHSQVLADNREDDCNPQFETSLFHIHYVLPPHNHIYRYSNWKQDILPHFVVSGLGPDTTLNLVFYCSGGNQQHSGQ